MCLCTLAYRIIMRKMEASEDHIDMEILLQFEEDAYLSNFDHFLNIFFTLYSFSCCMLPCQQSFFLYSLLLLLDNIVLYCLILFR